jgi:hypothetical protein
LKESQDREAALKQQIDKVAFFAWSDKLTLL